MDGKKQRGLRNFIKSFIKVKRKYIPVIICLKGPSKLTVMHPHVNMN